MSGYARIGSEAATSTRPAWASAARLPSYESLRYVQTLVVAIAAVGLAVYVASRAARDPHALARAARKRAGV